MTCGVNSIFRATKQFPHQCAIEARGTQNRDAEYTITFGILSPWALHWMELTQFRAS